MMALVARLEVQAKHRIVERNFAAARYQLAVPRERPWKLRLALVALRLSPRLMRAAYLRMRPSTGKPGGGCLLMGTRLRARRTLGERQTHTRRSDVTSARVRFLEFTLEIGEPIDDRRLTESNPCFRSACATPTTPANTRLRRSALPDGK